MVRYVYLPPESAPRGIALVGLWTAVVADAFHNCLWVVDIAGTDHPTNVVRCIGGPGDFRVPCGVCALGSDEVAVTDRGTNRVQIARWGDGGGGSVRTLGVEKGTLKHLSGIAFTGTALVVADSGHKRIVALCPSVGTVLAAVGGFVDPYGVAALGGDVVAVSDMKRGDVTVVTLTGSVLRTIGGWDRPRGVAGVSTRMVVVDRVGVWTVDCNNNECCAPQGDSGCVYYYCCVVGTDSVVTTDMANGRLAVLI